MDIGAIITFIYLKVRDMESRNKNNLGKAHFKTKAMILENRGKALYICLVFFFFLNILLAGSTTLKICKLGVKTKSYSLKNC